MSSPEKIAIAMFSFQDPYFYMAAYNNTQLHLWFPDLLESKGGIQVYSNFLLEALQASHPNFDYDICLKHSTRIQPELSSLPNTRFHFAGTWPLSLRTPAFAAQIIRIGLWQRPHLVVATHLNFTVAAYWLKLLVGVPYWTAAHGVEAWNIKRPALKKALHEADRVLAASSYTRDRLLQEQSLDPNKVLLLPCTFDPSRFQIAPKPIYLLERYNLRLEQPIILTVSRLASTEQYKGYVQILKALPQIRQVVPDIHYLLAGKGSDLPRIKQLISELQLQDSVTLAGFVPDQELCDHYNLCDVFAMPSKREGFGIVYLEALACGKPTLGGNKDGAIDALCHGELGALVDPDDIEEISQTVIQILQGTYPNPVIYQPEVLRQKVVDTFGFERFKQTLAALIQHSPLGPHL